MKAIARRLLASALMLPCASRADFVDEASQYVGYTIIAVKRIEAFIDSSGKKTDGFEGCESGRTIIFADGTAVTCRNYGYQYAYNPQAIILGQKFTYQGKELTQLKMIVGDHGYDVSGR